MTLADAEGAAVMAARPMRFTEWISRALWAVVLAAALLSGLLLTLLYVTQLAFRELPDISAPQLAAEMALYLAVAVIPYVFARAWDGITRRRQ